MTVINHRKHNNLTANKKNMVNKTKKSCRDLFLQLFLHLQFGTRIHLDYIATIYANHLEVASLMHRYVYTFQIKTLYVTYDEWKLAQYEYIEHPVMIDYLLFQSILESI